MTPTELARKIDHTILKPEAQAAEVDQIVAEAIAIEAAAVCVSPIWVRHVAEALRGSGVLICTVASFPHGTSQPCRPRALSLPSQLTTALMKSTWWPIFPIW